jgi:hypothetical protein
VNKCLRQLTGEGLHKLLGVLRPLLAESVSQLALLDAVRVQSAVLTSLLNSDLTLASFLGGVDAVV